tara:strand:+ start:572 stop:1420 length:849 start_codon:yes stop_codon:yes gene_type:complete
MISLGDWKIIPIESGDFRLDGGAMMGTVPKVLWEKTNPPDKFNRIDLAMRCLLLDDGKNLILIESGIGNKFEDDFEKRFNIVQTKNPLEDKLIQSGYHIDDITHVILTHLHFDHCGGATKYSNGEIVPAFKNAKYYISKQNWDLANNPNPRDRASYLNINFKVLNNSNILNLVPNNSNIKEGVSTITVSGHTFGQQLIKIYNNNETLLFCSDLIPLKSHLNIPWIMGYDLNALKTLNEKSEILEQACQNSWWLWFYHDPKVVAVKIKKGKKYYDIEDEIIRC